MKCEMERIDKPKVGDIADTKWLWKGTIDVSSSYEDGRK